ncbi:MAG: hypothetical protein AAGD96_32360, partial [Chloroflexota bacterium]
STILAVLKPKVSNSIYLALVYVLFPLMFLGLFLNQKNLWNSTSQNPAIQLEFKLAQRGRSIGNRLHNLLENEQELPRVGIIVAGGFAHTYGGESVDLMGLNNVLMAHNGGDRVGLKNHAAFEKDSFYELMPDVVHPQLINNDRWDSASKGIKNSWTSINTLKNLFQDEKFLEQYDYVKISKIEATDTHSLVGWFKKDYLNTLESTGQYDIERSNY